MSPPLNPKEFKTLEKYWYKLLEYSGWQDCEDTNNDSRPLKSWHSLKYQAQDPVRVEALKIYYEKAQDLLNTYPFHNLTHRKIWELHCEGIDEREIAYRIKVLKKSMVHLIIANLARRIR